MGIVRPVSSGARYSRGVRTGWNKEHLALDRTVPSYAHDRLGIRMYSATAIAKISIAIFFVFMICPSWLLPQHLRLALPSCSSPAHSREYPVAVVYTWKHTLLATV